MKLVNCFVFNFCAKIRSFIETNKKKLHKYKVDRRFFHHFRLYFKASK